MSKVSEDPFAALAHNQSVFN